MIGKGITKSITICCLVFLYSTAYLHLVAQTKIHGTVQDALSQKKLAYVSITLLQTSVGTSSNQDGYFELIIPDSIAKLQFSLVGYKTLVKEWRAGQSQAVNITLDELSETLDVVQVASGKTRYHNKNNPAVELIRQVIAHKPENQLSHFDQVAYQEYEKIHFAISNVPRLITNNVLLKKYKFVFENTDTTKVPGWALMPVYLEEQMADQYRSKNPARSKTIIRASRKTKLDDRYVQNQNIETFFKFLYGKIDIYDNDIIILTKPFLSPLAASAPLFYKFYITDTLLLSEGERVIELAFEPRNQTDRLFTGKLHISMDGRYAVQLAELHVSENANFNWIDDLRITFNFQRSASGDYLPSKLDNQAVFSLANSKKGAFGQRTLIYSNYNTSAVLPDSIFAGQQLIRTDTATHTDSFWQLNRPVSLTQTEANTYTNVDSLNNMRSFNRLLKWTNVFVNGYLRTGDAELGPLEYTYSFNPVEGNRLRAGGRTSPQFSKFFYGEGYLAYGFKDERFKFLLSGAYSLNNKAVAHYPANYLKATVQQEVNTPGDVLEFVNGDSFFGSFRRGSNDRWIYNKLYKLEHFYEFGNHVRLLTHVSYLEQNGTSSLPFVKANIFRDTLRGIGASELGVEWRWAPGEQFYQRNLSRKALPNGFPVFSLAYRLGMKGIGGGQYDYHNLQLTIFKRIFLAQLGFADAYLGGGRIWGTLPYPLLNIPNANQSYLVTSNAFSLMNDLEFVSDKYINLSISQHFGGFFLNRIPLLKRLKMRELVRFRLLYGGLSSQNRPENNSELLHFPTDKSGNTGTFSLEDRPYMELNMGLENILNFLKIEYVKRLSYLNQPDISRDGFRFSVSVDF